MCGRKESTRRRTTSIKADPKLNKKFKDAVAKMGMDVCFVEDCFRQAFLQGVEATNQMDPKTLSETAIRPIVIHVDNPHFHYEVLRPRRRKRMEVEEEYEVQDMGSSWKCAFCSTPPSYIIYNWITSKNCNQIWLCKTHFQEKKKKISSWKPI